MERIKNLLLYAGLDRERLERVKLDCLQENLRNLRIYSFVLMTYFFGLGLISQFTSGFYNLNAWLYLETAVNMAIIHFIARRLQERRIANDRLIMFPVYAFMVAVYVEALLIACIHAEVLAVTFIGVLLVLPMLFSARPYQMLLLQCTAVAAFCAAVLAFKEPEVARMDVWNALTFLLVSDISVLVAIPMRIGALDKAYEIRYISEHDVTTGLQNRTSYEQRLDALEEVPEGGAAYVYGDVNGLHDLNNTKGHEAGDQMLRTVAGQLAQAFGEAACYRIGGDEFVVLAEGLDRAQVEGRLAQLEADFAAQDYHVSFGCAYTAEEAGRPRELIKAAETRMYQAKSDYYLAHHIDRRRS